MTSELATSAQCRIPRSILTRYRNGEPRKVIFRDLVIDSIREIEGPERIVLDIGCGHGFDGDAALQASIAAVATRSIGIEPDPLIELPQYFSETHRTTLEGATLDPNSVHVAYSTFVLEHVQTPSLFWQKLYDALAPGGVFWGFTVDARHPFCMTSRLLERLKLKDFYLNTLHGRRGEDRYENYPTCYRMNRPGQIRRQTRQFSAVDFLTVHRVGQMNSYFPKITWRPVHFMERISMAMGLPGSILVVRLQK